MNYEWVEVYDKLSKLLLKFYQNNASNIVGKSSGEVFYNKCMNSKYRDKFIALNPWIEKFETIHNVRSIDPIHIFASFNSWNISETIRIKKLQLYFNIVSDGLDDFELSKYKSKLSVFKYFPHIQITRVVSARSLEEQKSVWAFFSELVQGKYNYELFSKLLTFYGIGYPSLTIFMFWVNSNEYLPLDKNTFGLLKKINDQLFGVQDAKNYFQLLNKNLNKSGNLYRKIAFVAIHTEILNSETIPDEFEEIEKYFEYISSLNSNMSDSKFIHLNEVTSKDMVKRAMDSLLFKGKFNIFAIKILKGTNPVLYKKLRTNKAYYFNQTFMIESDELIEYFPENDIELYSGDTLNINLNAIVGKNGQGKSTLTELMLLAINNIAVHLDKNEQLQIEEYTQEKLNIIIYMLNIDLYRIEYINNELSIYKYRKKNNNFINPQKVSASSLDNFFYTIYLNYSLHSFNDSEKYFSWLNKLFHKTDAYQTPVVIEPKRSNGNMDINEINRVAKDKLLYQLLSVFTPLEEKLKYKKLTEDKAAVGFVLKKNKSKIKNIREKVEKSHIDKKRILNYYLGENSINLKENNVKSEIANYIIYKVIQIYETYYKDYYANDLTNRLSEFLSDNLQDNNSHITFKLFQAINFYKYYQELSEIYELNIYLDLKTISEKVEKLRINKQLTSIHLMPPGIFKWDIKVQEIDKEKGFLKGEYFDFHTLSSGEKQIIFSIGTIINHINNLNSIINWDSSEHYKYESVNIILDEIELYFHPEFQRIFVNRLIKELINNYDGLAERAVERFNIIFITHSPFILSDIIKTNVLFLEDGNTSEMTTFASNIHEILSSSFFLNNTIGEFALLQIREVLDFYKKFTESQNIRELQEEYEEQKNKFKLIVRNIGEKYIKGILKDHLDEIQKSFNKLNDENSIVLDQEIKFLTNRLKELEEKKNRLK